MCRQLEGSIEVWDNRGPEDSGNQYLGMGRDCGLSSGKKGVYAIRLLGILGIDVVAKSRWFNPVPGMITDYSDYQEQAGSTYVPIIPDNVKEKINQFNENWEEHNKNYRGRVWLFRRRVAATIGSILLALTVANFAYEYSNDGPAEKMSVMEEYYPNGAPNP